MSDAGELHELDPIRGLPELLPEGEEIIWQGQPRWWSLCRRAFHVDLVAAYFAALVIWSVVMPAEDAGTPLLAGLLVTVVLGAIAVGTFMLLALFMCRTTVYTLTNRRVVMQFGVALPINLNLPFSRIEAADHRRFRDGTGDIPLRLTDEDRTAYLLLWPHVRPWRLGRPEPMLRCLPDSELVAERLAQALSEFHTENPSPKPAVDANDETDDETRTVEVRWTS